MRRAAVATGRWRVRAAAAKEAASVVRGGPRWPLLPQAPPALPSAPCRPYLVDAAAAGTAWRAVSLASGGRGGAGVVPPTRLAGGWPPPLRPGAVRGGDGLAVSLVGWGEVRPLLVLAGGGWRGLRSAATTKPSGGGGGGGTGGSGDIPPFSSRPEAVAGSPGPQGGDPPPPPPPSAGSDIDVGPDAQVPLRRLFSLAIPERSRLAVALGAQLVSSGATMAFPLALGRIVDAVQLPATTGAAELHALTLGMGALFGIAAVATAVRTSTLTIVGERVSRRLRTDTFTAILRQETAFFDKTQSGELVNRLSADTASVASTLTDNVARSLRAAVTSAAGLGCVLYLSPSLSLVALATFPPIAGGAYYFGRAVRELSRRLLDSLAAATQVAAERIGAVRAVRSAGAEGVEAARYAAAVGDSYALARRVALVSGAYNGGISFAAQASLLGVLAVGGGQVLSGGMTVGELSAFAMYSVTLGGGLSAMASSYTNFTKAQGAGARIFAVLDRVPRGDSSTLSAVAGETSAAEGGAGMGKGGGRSVGASSVGLRAAFADVLAMRSSWREVGGLFGGSGRGSGGVGDAAGGTTDGAREADPSATPPLWVPPPAAVAAARRRAPGAGVIIPTNSPLDVAFEDVWFAYPARPEVPVLRGLSLEVPAGCVTAAVGASGCGKSTLCLLLSRLYEPDAGRITVNGVDIARVHLPSLRDAVAVVAQSPHLFDGTVRDALLYPSPPTDAAAAAAAAGDVAGVDDALREALAASAAGPIFAGIGPGVGLDTRVGEGGAALSGGQRARVALSRALLRRSGILTTDEVTAGLDTSSARAVGEALRAVAAGGPAVGGRPPVAVLVVAHRLDAMRQADTVAVLRAGRVVEVGSWSDLIAARGVLYKMVREGGPRRGAAASMDPSAAAATARATAATAAADAPGMGDRTRGAAPGGDGWAPAGPEGGLRQRVE
ncbi:hypothetical protein MMPV_000993 [Pyropia vietnamensis]